MKLNPDSVTEQKFKNMNQHKSILNKSILPYIQEITNNFQVDFEQPYQTGQVESS